MVYLYSVINIYINLHIFKYSTILSQLEHIQKQNVKTTSEKQSIIHHYALTDKILFANNLRDLLIEENVTFDCEALDEENCDVNYFR